MKNLTDISKFLSLVLRHQPGKIGIDMDREGWVDVNELLVKCRPHLRELDLPLLQKVVAMNDKQRFAFNRDNTQIRASQGHTVHVDLKLEERNPPEYLYHGTVDRFIESIRSTGLSRMERQHVHLSQTVETALKVGSRRGKPVLLKIRALEMYQDGHRFYLSQNDVWLCDAVPAQYIDI